MKSKPNKLERMLRTLFPDACTAGSLRIKRAAKKTLAEAWKSANEDTLTSVIQAAKIPVRSGKSKCWCGSRYCVWGMSASDIRAAFKGKVPGRLRQLYAKA